MKELRFYLRKKLFVKIVFAVLIFVGGMSSVSYETKAASYTLTYDIIDYDEKTVRVTGFLGNASGDLVIPDTVRIGEETFNVTEIGKSAFADCTGFDGTLKIGANVRVIQDYAFSGCEYLSGFLEIPDSVETIGEFAFSSCRGIESLSIGSKVKTIGNSAFAMCNNLTGDLEIPDSVEIIGERAFYGCEKITGTLVIPDNVEEIREDAFAFCKKIETISIGDKVKTIGKNAFWGCENLTGTLEIPNCVEIIGEGAFDSCKEIEAVSIGSNVETIGSEAFLYCEKLSGNLVIPDSVEEIGDKAFSFCKEIEAVSIGSNVETIGNEAFLYCEKLSGPLVIPDSVEIIGDKAFLNIDGITTITIGAKVKTIGNSAFEDCGGLKSISLGTNVETIGNRAFIECVNLTGNLEIPDGVKIIGDQAFACCEKLGGNLEIPDSVEKIGVYAFYDCEGFESLLIGANVKTIGSNAFYDCENITGTLIIPDSVEEIGDNAFKFCRGLNSLTIGANVKTIGNNAFYDCENITGTLIIPDSVEEIGDEAFVFCKGLNSLTIGANVKIIGSNAFSDCENITGDLKISDNVEEIGENAFINCDKLGTIQLPAAYNGVELDIGHNYSCRCMLHDFQTDSGIDVSKCSCDICDTKNLYFKDIEIKLINPTYNGKELKPTVIITDGDYTLVEGVDYSILCDKQINAGNKYLVVIMGKTNYAGMNYHIWNINKAIPEIPDIKVMNGLCGDKLSDVKFEDHHFSWEDSSCALVGDEESSEPITKTFKAIYTPDDTDNYEIVTFDVNVEISHVNASPVKEKNVAPTCEKDGSYDEVVYCEKCKTELSRENKTVGKLVDINNENIKVNITNPTYDGSELAPTVEIKDGEKTLEAGKDYELACEKQTNAGEYEIAIKGINAYGGIIKTTWKINKATLSDDMLAKIKNEVLANLKGKCGDALSTITFEDLHMAWEDSTCVMIGDEEKDEPITRTFKAIYTPDDTDNYEIASLDVNVEISHVKASPVKENNVEPTYEKDGSFDEVVYCESCKVELSRDKKTVGMLKKDDPDVPVGLENGDVINLAKKKCMIMIIDVKKHEVSYYKSTNKKAKTISVPATVKIDGITFKVTAISDNAFKNSKKATKIVISANVKKLGKNLFKNLKKLKTIEIKSTKLTKKTIDKKTFAGLNKKATIKVPKKKLKAYKKLFKTKGLNKKIKVK